MQLCHFQVKIARMTLANMEGLVLSLGQWVSNVNANTHGEAIPVTKVSLRSSNVLVRHTQGVYKRPEQSNSLSLTYLTFYFKTSNIGPQKGHSI